MQDRSSTTDSSFDIPPRRTGRGRGSLVADFEAVAGQFDDHRRPGRGPQYDKRSGGRRYYDEDRRRYRSRSKSQPREYGQDNRRSKSQCREGPKKERYSFPEDTPRQHFKKRLSFEPPRTSSSSDQTSEPISPSQVPTGRGLAKLLSDDPLEASCRLPKIKMKPKGEQRTPQSGQGFGRGSLVSPPRPSGRGKLLESLNSDTDSLRYSARGSLKAETTPHSFKIASDRSVQSNSSILSSSDIVPGQFSDHSSSSTPNFPRGRGRLIGNNVEPTQRSSFSPESEGRLPIGRAKLLLGESPSPPLVKPQLSSSRASNSEDSDSAIRFVSRKLKNRPPASKNEASPPHQGPKRPSFMHSLGTPVSDSDDSEPRLGAGRGNLLRDLLIKESECPSKVLPKGRSHLVDTTTTDSEHSSSGKRTLPRQSPLVPVSDSDDSSMHLGRGRGKLVLPRKLNKDFPLKPCKTESDSDTESQPLSGPLVSTSAPSSLSKFLWSGVKLDVNIDVTKKTEEQPKALPDLKSDILTSDDDRTYAWSSDSEPDKDGSGINDMDQSAETDCSLNPEALSPKKQGVDKFEVEEPAVEMGLSELRETMTYSEAVIHGGTVKPVTNSKDLNVQSLMREGLEKKRVRELTRSQKYGVPALSDQKDLVLIGSPQSGKTMTYIIPLLSELFNRRKYATLPVGSGARCIMLASCARNVNVIGRLCSALVAANLAILTTHGGGLEMERKDELVNGCDVLISTPRCLLRLLQYASVTNLMRLCHLVLDDVDVLLNLYQDEVVRILSIVSKLRARRAKAENQLDVQMVAVGEKWSKELEERVLPVFKNPLLCITSFLEASIYGKVSPSCFLVEPNDKADKTIELIKANQNYSGLICCSNHNEVVALRSKLSPHFGVLREKILFAHGQMNIRLFKDILSNWVHGKEGTSPLLICDDSALSDIPVTDAQWLLHYSLPENKFRFSRRFSTIKDNLVDRVASLSSREKTKQLSSDVRVDIFIDSDNNEQFPLIMSFMERLGASAPEDYSVLVKNIEVKKEASKRQALLCDNILRFGSCRRFQCPEQHVMSSSRDSPAPHLPRTGWVRVEILKVIDSSHFSARILACTYNVDKEEWTPHPNNFTEMGFEINSYFADRGKRLPYGLPKVGDIAGVEVEIDTVFRRVQVIKILERDDKRKPLIVLVHHIDEGTRDTRKVTELLELPMDLKSRPPQSVDLFLNGIVPVDMEPMWSSASRRTVEKILLGRKNRESFFSGRICMVIGTAIIIDNLKILEYSNFSKVHAILFSLRKEMYKREMALCNSNHLPNLLKLAKEAGIELPPEPKAPQVPIEETEEVVNEVATWGFLDEDAITDVLMSYVVGPHRFFLMRRGIYDRVAILEKDIGKLMSQQKIPLSPSELTPDFICVALNSHDEWNRCMIVKKKDEETVEVMFVDHGDIETVSIDNLARIPPGMVETLNFQAVECSLALITLPEGHTSWSPESVELLANLTMRNELSIPLQVKVMGVSCDPDLTKGKHFSVVLVNKKKGIIVNTQLVRSLKATWIGEELTEKDLDLSPEESEGSDDSDDDLSIQDEPDSYLPEFNEEDFECGPSPIAFLRQLTNAETVSGITDKMEKVFIKLEGEKDPPTTPALKNTELQTNGEIEVPKKASDESEPPVTRLPLIVGNSVFPEVKWHQSAHHVYLEISVLDTGEKYKLESDGEHLFFHAPAGKPYAFHIDLFGPVHVDTVVHFATGLFVQVKLEKYLKGRIWPRLVYGKVKLSWVKFNQEALVRAAEKEDNIWTELKETGEMCMAKGHFIDPGNKIVQGGPYEDSDACSSSSSDVQEFDDIPHDPHNPLD